jgi:hypothetical protein
MDLKSELRWMGIIRHSGAAQRSPEPMTVVGAEKTATGAAHFSHVSVYGFPRSAWPFGSGSALQAAPE